MQIHFRKTELDQRSKRYLRVKKVKDKESIVFCPSLSYFAFFFTFFASQPYFTTNGQQNATALRGTFLPI